MEDWQSELKQVKWHINSNWPNSKTAIIDTPGFSQLRPDTSLEMVTLYNSKGIQIERQDGFSKYYFRSNIVIWCIHSGKLQDREALDKLEEVYIEGKIILGVITHIDRIPYERWNEIMLEAQNTFGKYIGKFVFSAAGSKDEKLKEETVNIVKREVENLFLEKESSVKIDEAIEFYNYLHNQIARQLTVIGEMFVHNCITSANTADDLNNSIQSNFEKTDSDVSNILQNYRNSILPKVANAYNSSDNNQDLFRAKITEIVDFNRINLDISKAMDAYNKNINNFVKDIFKATDWKTVKIGGGHVSLNSMESKLNVLVNLENNTKFQLHLNDENWIGATLGVGGVAAVAGMLLLGPIGLLSAGIGYFVGKAVKREEYINTAQKAITEGINKYEEEVADKIYQQTEKVQSECENYLFGIFQEINGSSLDYVIQNIKDIDMSLDSIKANQGEGKLILYDDYKGNIKMGYSKLYYTLVSELTEESERQTDIIKTYINSLFTQLTAGYSQEVNEKVAYYKNIPFSHTQSLLSNSHNGDLSLISDSITNNPLLNSMGINKKYLEDIEEYGIDLDLQKLYEAQIIKMKESNSEISRIEQQWNSRITKDIDSYIETVYEGFTVAVREWSAICGNITATLDQDRIAYLDFQKYVNKHLGSMKDIANLYNANPEVLKQDVFEWKWADGSSCKEAIFRAYNNQNSKSKQEIVALTDQFESNWDKMAIGYCENILVEKFNDVQSKLGLDDYKRLSEKVNIELNQYIKDNTIEAVITSAFIKTDIFRLFLSKFLDLNFSDDILAKNVLNIKLIKLAFHINMNGEINAICRRLRSDYGKIVCQNILLSEREYYSTKKPSNPNGDGITHKLKRNLSISMLVVLEVVILAIFGFLNLRLALLLMLVPIINEIRKSCKKRQYSEFIAKSILKTKNKFSVYNK